MASHGIGHRGSQLQVFGGVSREAQLGVRIRCQILSVDDPYAVEAAFFYHSGHLRKGSGNREAHYPYFRIALIHENQPLVSCCAPVSTRDEMPLVLREMVGEPALTETSYPAVRDV